MIVRRLCSAAAGIPAAAFLFLVLSGCSEEQARDAEGSAAESPLLEAPASDASVGWKVVDSAGVVAEIERLSKDKTLALNLWATWCSPCMAELPDFARVAKERGDVRFLGLSADGVGMPAQEKAASQTEALQAWKRMNMPYGSLVLDEGDLDPLLEALQLRSGQLPQTILYRNGRSLVVHEGRMSAEELESLLDEHL